MTSRSPDNSQTAWVVSFGELFAIDLKEARVRKTELPYFVNTLNISPDDAVLYLHDNQQGVRLYEPQSGTERCKIASIRVNPADETPTTQR